MESDNVIDITDKGKLMARMVEEDAVQLVEMGSSGKNYCVTFSKNALIAMREGRTFSLELLMGDKKISFNMMRDNVFKKKMRTFKKINEQAKESAQATIEANKAAGLGKSLGEKLDEQ